MIKMGMRGNGGVQVNGGNMGKGWEYRISGRVLSILDVPGVEL